MSGHGLLRSSGDNQMSALGAGAVAEGTWVISLGTSGTLFGVSNRPIEDKSGGIAPFCDATGAWMPLLCTMNCTLVTEEVCRACCCTDLAPDEQTLGLTCRCQRPWLSACMQ